MTVSRSIDALLQLMERLRHPTQGCDWDRAQNFASIVPHTIEEAYELAQTIADARPDSPQAQPGPAIDHIREELGDLLFQVVFFARLAQERGWFDFESVARGIHDKLVQRHPHLFADAQVADAAGLSRQWDEGKRRERIAAGLNGALAGVAVALPALTRAAKLGRRAAGLGFDWEEADGARRKLDEELAEFDQAVAAGESRDIDDELGDLLFSVVNIARHHGRDPEAALRAANGKFERRFAAMEALAAERGVDVATLDPAAWEALWQDAKRRLAAPGPETG
jgi:ATP diphosphatase